MVLVVLPQQFRQTRDVRRYPASLVHRENFSLHRLCRSASIHPGDDGVTHDVSSRHSIGAPVNGEAAGRLSRNTLYVSRIGLPLCRQVFSFSLPLSPMTSDSSVSSSSNSSISLSGGSG